MTEAAVESEPAPAPQAPARRCENCGAALYGEHCYACGQPTKGLVRHFTSILGDFFDTVFNIDSRVLRTVWPLLARPGYLSLEYFAGRRVRYVTPMRLFLFLSLVGFFCVQGTIDYGDDGKEQNKGGIHVGAQNKDSFDEAKTPAEVDAVLEQALAEMAKARKEVENVPGATVGIDLGIDKIKRKARDRKDYLARAEAARAAGKPPPPEEAREEGFNDMRFNDKPWDPVTNPLDTWFPAAVDASLNRRMQHAVEVLKASKSQKPLVDAMFNVLPQTLLVMMPIFALMLKLAYLFKRRLYMEHLIVALHSHSFIALEVILIVGLSWLIGIAPGDGFWENTLGWLRGLAFAWIPLYLLLMQKRVYGQGWPMTLAKFFVLGLCYTVLLSIAMVASIILGLLTL
jgi:hypothetical protein